MRADLGADVEAMRLNRQAEKLIEESGIPYTFLRPNEFMQGFINFQGTTIKSTYQQKIQKLALLTLVILQL